MRGPSAVFCDSIQYCIIIFKTMKHSSSSSSTDLDAPRRKSPRSCAKDAKKDCTHVQKKLKNLGKSTAVKKFKKAKKTSPSGGASSAIPSSSTSAIPASSTSAIPASSASAIPSSSTPATSTVTSTSGGHGGSSDEMKRAAEVSRDESTEVKRAVAASTVTSDENITSKSSGTKVQTFYGSASTSSNNHRNSCPTKVKRAAAVRSDANNTSKSSATIGNYELTWSLNGKILTNFKRPERTLKEFNSILLTLQAAEEDAKYYEDENRGLVITNNEIQEKLNAKEIENEKLKMAVEKLQTQSRLSSTKLHQKNAALKKVLQALKEKKTSEFKDGQEKQKWVGTIGNIIKEAEKFVDN